MSKRRDSIGPLDRLSDDALWLLQEERAELGETDIEADLAFRELAARIRDGKPLQGGTDWEYDDMEGNL